MKFAQAFPVAIIDEDFDGKSAAGRGMKMLAEAYLVDCVAERSRK